MTAALALALFCGGLADEHAEVKARLDAERATLEALAGDRTHLLAALDAMERLARASTERTARLERVRARAQEGAARARAEATVVEAALVARRAALAPRLLPLYRLRRQGELGLLLSASDFTALLRRQRALKALVAGDVAALDDLALLQQWERRQAARLERFEASAARAVEALQVERAVGEQRLARFRDVLALATAEGNRVGRLIADLEQSERELSEMMAELSGAAGLSGFGALRGHLPYPVEGLVEAGFGRVVNPRFNTVTMHKGLDLRAPAGAPVRSVGPGVVVFSDWLKGYGNLVIVDHGDEYHSLYAHLDGRRVGRGAAVEEGDLLGGVGDTGSLKGAFLYFELRRRGRAIDPLPWLEPR